MKAREEKEKKAREEAHYYAGQKKGLWWKYLLAALIIFIYLMPLYVLLMQSLKSDTDISSAMSFPEVWYFDNYLSIIEDGTMLRAILNSAVVGVSTVLLEIVLACMAAYPLAMVFLPSAAAGVAFYGYVVPFLVSTVAGSILAGILVAALRRSGALKAMKASLNASHV